MNDSESVDLNILDLPYSDRQLIVVTDDSIAEAAQKEERKAVQMEKKGVDWQRIVEAIVMDVIPIPFTRIITEVSREAIRAWGRARQSGLNILPIGKSSIHQISFPPGHPREGVLYIGHPALPNVYYTIAEFHRATFEHKFSEAVNLLMSLGAVTIRVEYIRGWSKDFSSRLSVPLGVAGESASSTTSVQSSSSTQLLYEATLSGTDNPAIPENLVWYPYENTWQAIAKGRIEFGLQDFSLSISYEDDFGVNAGLKASVAKTGLDLGGKFEDHQSTVWHVKGKFKISEDNA
jgi:hypothetical protein